MSYIILSLIVSGGVLCYILNKMLDAKESEMNKYEVSLWCSIVTIMILIVSVFLFVV